MLKDLVVRNRSIRGYDESVKISRETLMELVDITRFTASSRNAQPLKYALVYESDKVKKVQSLTMWAKQLPEMKLPHEGKCPTAFIIICQDTDIKPNLQAFLRDVGICAQTILLSATEMGLGGCMIGSFNAGELKTILALPDNIVPQLVIAIGKPAETIILADVKDGNTNYYRDENDVHYVPKRALKDILL